MSTDKRRFSEGDRVRVRRSVGTKKCMYPGAIGTITLLLSKPAPFDYRVGLDDDPDKAPGRPDPLYLDGELAPLPPVAAPSPRSGQEPPKP